MTLLEFKARFIVTAITENNEINQNLQVEEVRQQKKRKPLIEKLVGITQEDSSNIPVKFKFKLSENKQTKILFLRIRAPVENTTNINELIIKSP